MDNQSRFEYIEPMKRNIHIYLSEIGRIGGSKMTPKKLRAIRRNVKLAQAKRRKNP